MDNLSLKTIAKIVSAFPTKFGVPRQSGMVEELVSTIVFEPEYRDPSAIRGLEDFSHLWLIWGFSEQKERPWSPTVRPPRLGGNTRMGVFATRSPNRPNPIALSCVRIKSIGQTDLGCVIHVLGADMMDGSPIYDIKPYLPYADCRTDAVGGFTDSTDTQLLKVFIDQSMAMQIPPEELNALERVLSLDPRPRYQDDPDRVYGMSFYGMEVKFRVEGETLTVISVSH